MSTDAAASPYDDQATPHWRPLDRLQRRVAGVLVEKAKTTPEGYPLSLNALTNGCNQKSNRSPQMNVDSEDVAVALDELREMGAAAEIQGGGRVVKFKHRLYEWLGVDKVEMAVMAELLLRGEQTVGELRGRAARMEPIADMNALKPVLASLVDKGLVLELTPPGRGQTVTHALYEPQEMEHVRSRATAAPSTPTPAPATTAPRSAPAPVADSSELAELRAEVRELREEVDRLTTEMREVRTLLG